MTAPSVPLSQFVLKLRSRCNLACDHCYVYEHVDQTWRDQPQSMAFDTLRVAAERIAEHARAHRLDRVTVVLHGGEPLLVGEERLRAMLTELRRTVAATTRVDLHMQSNGLLLTPSLCELLTEFDVHVGISLDGDRRANDRHRRFADGRSSHADVLRAVALLNLPRFLRIFAGPTETSAATHFQRYRDWTLAAIDAIVRTKALTALGMRFVGRMADTTSAWDL